MTQLIPDFRCEVDLTEGIKRYLIYMAEHPDLRIEDAEYDEWCDNLIRDYRSFMKLLSTKY